MSNTPLARVMAEATASRPNIPRHRSAVVLLFYVSTRPTHSRQARKQVVALMDYQRKGELDMSTGEALRVFRRHARCSYVVKPDSGNRSLVLSWFVGNAAAVPPNTLNRPTIDGIHTSQ
ncbi:hypothetical protein AB1N83_003776 [Pleurotus pulmonarius]